MGVGEWAGAPTRLSPTPHRILLVGDNFFYFTGMGECSMAKEKVAYRAPAALANVLRTSGSSPEAVMVIEDDETEDDDASFWRQSHQKPSRREKSAWTRCSTHKAKVRKGEVKEELLQVKEKVLEVEQTDSPADSEVMEIDAPAAEVQAAQPPNQPTIILRPSAPAATPG